MSRRKKRVPTDPEKMKKVLEDLRDPGQGEGSIQAGDQLYRAMKAGLLDPSRMNFRSDEDTEREKKKEPVVRAKGGKKSA